MKQVDEICKRIFCKQSNAKTLMYSYIYFIFTIYTAETEVVARVNAYLEVLNTTRDIAALADYFTVGATLVLTGFPVIAGNQGNGQEKTSYLLMCKIK